MTQVPNALRWAIELRPFGAEKHFQGSLLAILPIHATPEATYSKNPQYFSSLTGRTSNFPAVNYSYLERANRSFP
jgi:hypothetical protein